MLSPVIDFNEFGKINARIIAIPTVATPSIRKSCRSALRQVLAEILESMNTHPSPALQTMLSIQFQDCNSEQAAKGVTNLRARV